MFLADDLFFIHREVSVLSDKLQLTLKEKETRDKRNKNKNFLLKNGKSTSHSFEVKVWTFKCHLKNFRNHVGLRWPSCLRRQFLDSG